MSEGRRGGREARRAVRTSVAVRSLPALQRRLPHYEVLTPEQLDRIHDTAMRVLEEIGIDFREDEALAVWAKAGAKVDDLCRKLGISSGTFYNWRSKYAGLEVNEAKRLRELESENTKLKRLLAEKLLEVEAMKDVLSKKW